MRGQKNEREVTQIFALGTPNEIVTVGVSAAEHQAVVAGCIDELKRIEAKFSRYRADSVVSVINLRAASEPVPVDEETALLLRYADEAWRLSQGCFDITTGILRRAWDFKAGVVPTEGAIAAACRRIGWSKVHWSGRSIQFTEPGMEIDLGGIGKEYAADRLREQLQQAGVPAASVNLGGDVAVFAQDPEQPAWRIGIRHPRDEQKTLGVITLRSGAIATSGDYERYFEKDGQRYCHILDPRTGYPAQGFQAVTVVADSCLVAGTVATSVMVMGISAGKKLLAEEGVRYLAVTGQGELWNGLVSR